MKNSNRSQLPFEKMQELIGVRVKWRDKEYEIVDVKQNKSLYGEDAGYELYLDKENYPRYYPFNFVADLNDWQLPQEFMEDAKQALNLRIQQKKENEVRAELLAKTPFKERIQRRYKESQGNVVYHLKICFHFSFEFTRVNQLLLRVGHSSGTLSIPIEMTYETYNAKKEAANHNEYVSMYDLREDRLTQSEINDFFTLYEAFDFYNPVPEKKFGFDGWSLCYTIYDEETDFYQGYWCPEKGEESWKLVDYAVNLFNKFVQPEELEDFNEALRKYAHV
jgi:hypothetical protein